MSKKSRAASGGRQYPLKLSEGERQTLDLFASERGVPLSTLLREAPARERMLSLLVAELLVELAAMKTAGMLAYRSWRQEFEASFGGVDGAGADDGDAATEAGFAHWAGLVNAAAGQRKYAVGILGGQVGVERGTFNVRDLERAVGYARELDEQLIAVTLDQLMLAVQEYGLRYPLGRPEDSAVINGQRQTLDVDGEPVVGRLGAALAGCPVSVEVPGMS